MEVRRFAFRTALACPFGALACVAVAILNEQASIVAVVGVIAGYVALCRLWRL
jgi:hypothetical protein